MATASPDEARLNFRLRREHKQLIEQAAQVLGQSVSDFAVAALVRDARKTLEEPGVTRLTDRDWEAFLRLLEAEAEPNEALRRAADRHRRSRA